jgi:glyoxylase-like metal-dependent hydrolase (beta-lactamase superfamily II)
MSGAETGQPGDAAGGDGHGDGVVELPGGIVQLDTLTAGVSHVTAGFLVRAPRPALIECGPSLTIDAVVAALADLGLDADDLAYLVVSHIHLDHAGGAGDIARAFGSATVVVSDIGARHLEDPPQETLAEAGEQLAAWAEVAREAVIEHDELDHVADTLARRFAVEAADEPVDEETARRLEVLGGFRTNGMGLLRYWRKRLADDDTGGAD